MDNSIIKNKDMKKEIIEKKKTNVSFKLGVHYTINEVLDILKKSKIEKFHFDIITESPNIVLIEHIKRLESDQEEEARNKKEKKIELEEKEQLKNLKEKYENK